MDDDLIKFRRRGLIGRDSCRRQHDFVCAYILSKRPSLPDGVITRHRIRNCRHNTRFKSKRVGVSPRVNMFVYATDTTKIILQVPDACNYTSTLISINDFQNEIIRQLSILVLQISCIFVIIQMYYSV